MFRSYSLLVCYLDDQASAMDTVSAPVQLGSASTTTDFCVLIDLSLSYYVCLCSFAVLHQHACSVTDPSCNLANATKEEINILLLLLLDAELTDSFSSPWCRSSLASLSYIISQGTSLSKSIWCQVCIPKTIVSLWSKAMNY